MSVERVPMRHRLLLRAYPAGWRERYGDEFLALLADRPDRWRDAVDILAGALDARLHPGRTPLSVTEMLPPARMLPTAPASTATYGIVTGVPPAGVLSRRAFMRQIGRAHV